MRQMNYCFSVVGIKAAERQVRVPPAPDRIHLDCAASVCLFCLSVCLLWAGYLRTKCNGDFMTGAGRQISDGNVIQETAAQTRTIQRPLLPYTVWVKKIPPRVFWKFFPNGWEFLINFLHTYYAIIYTLDYKFLFKYLQLWQSYAILSATT